MPIVQLARFSEGVFELFREELAGLEYIAISHVWGAAKWLQLPTIPGEFFVSPQKATFIEERLPGLVGSTPFWMDVLAVDQKKRADVVGVIQHIPAIYRGAMKTIAIRESDGLYSCCAKAVADATEWSDLMGQLSRHARNHIYEVYKESYLQRLWPLEECLLSDTIQFVECEPGKSAEKADRPFDDLSNYGSDPHGCDADVTRILISLYSLAYSFAAVLDAAEMDLIFPFIEAYIHLRTISRRRPIAVAVSDPADAFDKQFYLMHSNSNRQASKSRDYIYSVTAQFKWYRPPENAKELDFSQAFQDFYRQAVAAGHPFTSRITQSMTDEVMASDIAWQPSLQQPNPDCLGDLLKLLGHRKLVSDKIHFTYGTTARSIEDDTPFVELLDLVSGSMGFSDMIWREARRGGTLSKFGSLPNFESYARMELEAYKRYNDGHEDAERLSQIEAMIAEEEHVRSSDSWLRTNALMALDLMFAGTDTKERNHAMRADWQSIKHDMLKQDRSGLKSYMLYYAAIVSCQLPLTAVDWVKQHFIPVRVEYPRVEVLALLSRHFSLSTPKHQQPDSGPVNPPAGWPLLSVGRHTDGEFVGKDLVLVHPLSRLPVGLLPDFLQTSRSDEEYVERMGMLYEFGKQIGEGDFGWALLPLDELKISQIGE